MNNLGILSIKRAAAIVLFLGTTFGAQAAQVCEIGTRPINAKGDVTLWCTKNMDLLPKDSDELLNPPGSTFYLREGESTWEISVQDRPAVKKHLLHKGYKPAPECGAYETYIKP